MHEQEGASVIDAVSGNLLLLALAAISIALLWASRTRPRDRYTLRDTIHDIPCSSCREGYGGPHRCDSPDYCRCDQPELHDKESIS